MESLLRNIFVESFLIILILFVSKSTRSGPFIVELFSVASRLNKVKLYGLGTTLPIKAVLRRRGTVNLNLFNINVFPVGPGLLGKGVWGERAGNSGRLARCLTRRQCLSWRRLPLPVPMTLKFLGLYHLARLIWVRWRR